MELAGFFFFCIGKEGQLKDSGALLLTRMNNLGWSQEHPLSDAPVWPVLWSADILKPRDMPKGRGHQSPVRLVG